MAGSTLEGLATGLQSIIGRETTSGLSELTGIIGSIKGATGGVKGYLKGFSAEGRMERIQKKEELIQAREETKIRKNIAKDFLAINTSILGELTYGLRSRIGLNKTQEEHRIAEAVLIGKIKEEHALTERSIKKRAEDEAFRQKHTLSVNEAMLQYSEGLEEQEKAWGEELDIKIDPVQLGVDTGGFPGGDWGAGGSFGVDSVTITSPTVNLTGDTITGLGLETDSPEDAGSPKLEPEDVPGTWQSIWGSAKEAAVADAGNPKLESEGAVSSSLLSTFTGEPRTLEGRLSEDETPAIAGAAPPIERAPEGAVSSSLLSTDTTGTQLGVDKTPALGVDVTPALGVDVTPAIVKDDDAVLVEVFDELTPDADIMDKFYEAGTTKGSIYVHDVNVEEKTNVLLSPMNSALAELVDQGRDEIAFDARREKREIREDALALEDRRDKKAAALDKKGSSGSPTLFKGGDEDGDGGGGGFIESVLGETIGRTLTQWGGKFLSKMKLGKLARPLSLLTSFLLPKMASSGFSGSGMLPAGTGTSPRLPTRTPTSPTVRPRPVVGGTGKGLQAAKNIFKTGAKIFSKGMVPLTIAMSAFEVFSTEANENLDRTEKNIAHSKTAGGLGGAAAGAMAGAAIGSVVPFIGTAIGGLIGGGLGYFLGSEIGETVAEEISDKTDTSNVSGNVTLSQEDKEALADVAEDSGAVDIGWGHGDIDDLEKLSKLDTDTLESLLDVETWADEDAEMIQSIIAAKMEGREMIFNAADLLNKKSLGMLGEAESLEFGEVGSAGSPTVQGVNVSDSGTETPLDGDKRLTQYESIEAISGEMEMAKMTGNTEELEKLQKQLDKVKAMSPDEFDNLTPDADIMDRFYEAGTTKGSIYVHDINVEKAMNSDWLDKLKVTAGEWAEQASQNSGQAASMVNAPTTIDQSSKQSVNVGSSAHAPAQPLGSGYMGVSTPRG